ncbi:MAG: leucine--tRNA ligase [Clostridia bacterium]|nr:leucine--tRNA ligase [Clostridia bacterium]MDD3093316.1 leucine--tRNA ligase [Clostridia bacterium]MDD4543732.1 leucine--tRNA ligase [Clostridia bacterium]
MIVMEYNPKEIESKWQKKWDELKCFKAKDDLSLPKYYALVEFPYPSGEGLHVGHPRPYTALDIVARKRRLQGYNVLFPMGWDAFGLPTENYAMKNKMHPAAVTKKNIARFKSQLKSIGYSFDWDREINTTDPNYYKWTQWIFLQLFNHGLAYKKNMSINYCTSCKVGLANEEVVDGKCERCGAEVIKKMKNQWMLKITEYADKLIEGLSEIDYLESIKSQQINWIGKSTGAEVDFMLTGIEEPLTVYTTRPDTLYGATYMVISPEHPYIEKYKSLIANLDEIKQYQIESSKKSDFERAEIAKDKTGVEIKGIRAINPLTDKEIPVWISDYVLMSYGTGAIMAVPGHDQRDYEFAKKFNLPIIEVVAGGDLEKEAFTDIEKGIMVNSGIINGLEVKDAKKKITEYIESKGIGKTKDNFKLRDWVFSRQRYWGEPIPLVYCEKCGWVPLDESELPLLLPDLDSYEPAEDGESPLSKMTDWVNTTCPKCHSSAKRETDTMPNWAGSSWYFLRYLDPNNDVCFADKEKINYWMPVDWYNGGMEHVTLHLLYSRFWHKFLYDIGYVNTPEPYSKRTAHGMILGENNEKMSKSRGNVVNPDKVIDNYGADTLRMYEMFIGDFEKSAPWSENGVKGCRRFIDRAYKMMDFMNDSDDYSKDLLTIMHKTIKKVTNDFETLKFNTAIAQLMAFSNAVYLKGSITKKEMQSFLILLNPVSPHITEEMWSLCGFDGYIHEKSWPEYDEDKTIDDEIEIVVQVNGKIKAKIMISSDMSKQEMESLVETEDAIIEVLEGKKPKKIIAVPKRLINIVI